MSQSNRVDILRFQFDLTWSLFESHLDQLTPQSLLWEPAPVCWNMRMDRDGEWIPDWDESDPNPIPVPTIGWLTWHIGWWWTTALSHARGRSPLDRTEIRWPGELATVIEWLRDLRTAWLDVLDHYHDEDLDAPASFPWGDDPEKTVAHTAAWLNVELMKNVAEIGQLRLQWAASIPRHQ